MNVNIRFFSKMNWKRRAWIISIVLDFVLFVPLAYLLPHGSLNPKDIGFWHVMFITFVPGIFVTYYIIKWRQEYISKHEAQDDN